MTPLRIALLALALTVPISVAGPAQAATSARHYDCSKAGNANKAACKVAAPAPKPAAAKPAKPAVTTTTSVTTKTTTRHYDCTKAGNKNKTECRTATAQTSTGSTPGAMKKTTTTLETTTDCAKWYNKARAACRTAPSLTQAHTTVAPAPKPVATTSRATVSSAGGENNNPAGASAQCKDGSYSHAAQHAGACSHHGGVAKWLK